MPKAIDHDQRRREIIDATWGLIVRGGLEAATMREIATEAGFANGALKHYFPGKDEIITGAYERAMEGVISRLGDSAVNLQGIDALRAIVTATMPMDDLSRESARVLLAFWERGLSSEAIRDSYQTHLSNWHRDLGALIAACREQGSISTSTPDEDLVHEIVLLNAGATALCAIGPQYATPAVIQRLIDDFFHRLTTVN
ncbi:MAG: TetR/AcrR family transcriptional regulator [Actinobacteria bacterium]|nr:TetR/AcrR family transcriptional regulator [Actinomycetota bacterium]